MKVDTFVHDFEEDLKWSEAPRQYVPYMQAVTHWWPDAEGWDRVTDISQQKQGKDITITVPSGESINIQFKARRKCYLDCSIEYRHDFDNGRSTPGWIEAESEAKYLLYHVPEGKVFGKSDPVPQRVYRIDYPALHDAWINHRDEWLEDKKFFHPDARNNGYWTRNVAIPWEVLESVGVEIDILEWFLWEPKEPEAEKEARNTRDTINLFSDEITLRGRHER